MAKEEMVFKLQRPLMTTEKEPHVLIYNEDRSVEGFLPMTEEVFNLFPESNVDGWAEQYKIFVKGMFDRETGNVDITEITEWQDW